MQFGNTITKKNRELLGSTLLKKIALLHKMTKINLMQGEVGSASLCV